MKAIFLSIILLALSMPVVAHGDPTTLSVEARDDDGSYFVVEGYDGKNPTLVLEPGESYIVQFLNAGGTQHSFRVAEGDNFATPIIGAGESATLEFTVPTSGFESYWCDLHQASGMTGKIVDSEKAIPGPSIFATLAGIAAVMILRRGF